MIDSGRAVVLDTWVLVHLMRDRAVGRAIEREYRLSARQPAPLISVVTVGEMYAFARSRSWGDGRQARLRDLLSRLVVVDINAEPILDGYAEISSWLRGNGRGVGHNDRWIAATARALDAVVLTGDRDFTPLHPHLVTCEWIDENTLGTETPRIDGES